MPTNTTGHMVPVTMGVWNTIATNRDINQIIIIYVYQANDGVESMMITLCCQISKMFTHILQ